MTRTVYGSIITNSAVKSKLERDIAERRSRRLSAQSIALAAALSGCAGQADADSSQPSRDLATAKAEASLPASPTKGQKIDAEETRFEGRTALTGVRISEGNAVVCAEIRTDDGVLHPVSGLTGAVAIGDRITVTGTYGVTTSCMGRVLIIKDVKRL